MISSHKELVESITEFCTKFPLINDFKYLKDAERIEEEVNNSEPRVFILSLDGMDIDRQEYNMSLNYGFVISDEVAYSDAEIIQSETDNMFCVTALSDYLSHVMDGEIKLNNISFTTVSNPDSNSFTSASGNVELNIKMNPSYWKIMDSYSV